MDFVSDEEVDERNECREERSGEELPVFQSSGIARAQREAANSPWQGSHEIRDHEDIVPVVVICRRDICPPSASQCSEDADSSDEFGEGRVRSAGQDIPETYKGESRA